MFKYLKKYRSQINVAIITSVITLTAGFFVGQNWRKISSQFLPYLGAKKPASSQLDWSELNNIYESLSSHYNGELDFEKLLSGAKKGLVDSLGDPYTNYMSSTEAKDFKKSLHGDVGAGVGIEMGLRSGVVKVLRTLPDNPARKAGVLAGDIIYKVNDENVTNLNVDKIAEKVRGPIGSKVKLTLLRGRTEHSFELTREKINNVSAYINYQGNTAIITLTRFDTDTADIVKKAVKDFPAKNISKVILDLRNNGGGYVDAATNLLSLWVSNQKVLIQKSLRHNDKIIHSKTSNTPLSSMKTIVLINGASASASEIVAGALKDYKKATILGEKSYGKGSMQTLLEIGSGELLKVTTASWYTPSGHSINKTGITPDKIIERSFDDINADRDPQLDAAFAF